MQQNDADRCVFERAYCAASADDQNCRGHNDRSKTEPSTKNGRLCANVLFPIQKINPKSTSASAPARSIIQPTIKTSHCVNILGLVSNESHGRAIDLPPSPQETKEVKSR
jgi:hypothetical protein